MSIEVSSSGEFKYALSGRGPVIVLLHGLFGALSNFKKLIDYFSPHFTIAIPVLPLYEYELEQTNIGGLLAYVERFISAMRFKKIHLIGNSMGGHVALMYSLKNQENVRTLTLTGSSGLFENSLGDTYPRKGDYEFVRKKTEATFYDPSMATTELVDEVYEIVNNRDKVIRMVYLARSALMHNLRDELHRLRIPANLIWGREDLITPSFVGEEFHKLIPGSELHLLSECGHAPMMEQPENFNRIMEQFLYKHP